MVLREIAPDVLKQHVQGCNTSASEADAVGPGALTTIAEATPGQDTGGQDPTDSVQQVRKGVVLA